VYLARIWTHNEAGGVLKLQASAGQYTDIDGPHRRIRMGELEIGRIAQSRRSHWSNEVPHDPNHSDGAWAEREGAVAFAGYPLVVENRTLGVLAIYARQPLSADVVSNLASPAERVECFIDRRQAEDGRMGTRREITASPENISDAFVRFDGDWRIVYANSEAERITRLPPVSG